MGNQATLAQLGVQVAPTSALMNLAWTKHSQRPTLAKAQPTYTMDSKRS